MDKFLLGRLTTRLDDMKFPSGKPKYPYTIDCNDDIVIPIDTIEDANGDHPEIYITEGDDEGTLYVQPHIIYVPKMTPAPDPVQEVPAGFGSLELERAIVWVKMAITDYWEWCRVCNKKFPLTNDDGPPLTPEEITILEAEEKEAEAAQEAAAEEAAYRAKE